MSLGADGVQIGSRFVATKESSAHINFKNEVLKIGNGETMLTLKELAPVRLIKNKFFDEIQQANNNGVSKEELIELLGKARAKKGMFEGDLDNGELEIGQVSSLINDIPSAKEVIESIVKEYNLELENLSKI